MRHNLPLLSAAVVAGLVAFCAPVAVGRAEVAPPAAVVLVLPFAAPSGAKEEWVGKAVQQDLLTDLTQGTTTPVLAPAGAPAAIDVQAALQAGHDQGASIVVFGQAQVAGSEIRLTGEVIDVVTGKPLGGLKATGPSDELFHLEDALSGQVFLAMPRTFLTAQTLGGIQQAGVNSGQPAETPVQTAVPFPTNAPTGVYATPNGTEPADVYAPQTYYSYPSYSYNYYDSPADSSYYPAYTYATPDLDWWPYWNSGIIVGGFSFGYHHHDHGGDFRGEGSHWNAGSALASTGREFVGAGAGFARTGTIHAAPVRSGFGSAGLARASAGSRVSSGGFHSSISRGASIGGFRGSFGGGFHAGGASVGGGGHR